MSKTLDERLGHLTYSDLCDEQPEETKSTRERYGGFLLGDHLGARIFQNDGVIVYDNLIPSDLLDAYCELRSQLPKDEKQQDNYWGGWHYPTPFMNHKELRDVAISKRVYATLCELTAEAMGLNLALTGWVSTQRNWHQDTYLNPIALGSRYVAAWIALDDIDPDSGPFEFVRGSHKWPVITQEKLFAHLSEEERTSPHWPTFTQDHLARICEQEMARRNAKVEQFIPKKGQVLFWHANLMHRGSKPKNPDLLRKSLICHYSSAYRTKIDMPKTIKHGLGFYFDLPSTGEVRP